MLFPRRNQKPVPHADDMSSGNTVRIIPINGRKFVTGLFWQPLTSPRSYMSEARTIGKKRNWDIVAIRKGVRIQAGFVSKNAGVMKGMYSLASALAGQLGDSWIGAFAVGNGEYAVIAVHDGSIVPGYDVITDKEDALSRLKQGYQLFQYDNERVYAPADFEFSQYEKSLESLLIPKNLKGEYRLKQLTFGLTKQELITVGICGVALMAGMYGWSEYKAYEQKKAREEQIRQEQLRQAELARLNANSRAKQGAEALQHPWAGMPGVVDFGTVCTAEIYALPLSVAGWQIDTAKCEAKLLTVTYKRKVAHTTVNDFIGALGDGYDGLPLFTDDGNTATVKRAVKMLFGGDEKVAEADTVQNAFLSHFQTVDVGLKLIEKKVTLPPPPPPPPSPPGQPPAPPPPAPVADWRLFSFEFETAIAPELLIAGLPDKNGVRVTKMEMRFVEDDVSLKWTVTGELYASK